MSNLINISDLRFPAIETLLKQARKYLNSATAPSSLANHLVTLLFFEPSTRTRLSFEVAAKNLEMKVLCPDLSQSSLKKGETMVDTVCNIHAMGCKNFIIRLTDHSFLDEISKILPTASFMNAGSGRQQHPTQVLSDLFTLTSLKPNLSELTIAIVGDIAHSRVANSFSELSKLIPFKEVRLIGPPYFLPEQTTGSQIKLYDNLKEGLQNVDVVMSLRIQQERIAPDEHPENMHHYIQRYQINSETIRFAKPDAIVMHPGPINRGIELTSEVADGFQSAILQQVRHGIAMRQALLENFFA